MVFQDVPTPAMLIGSLIVVGAGLFIILRGLLPLEETKGRSDDLARGLVPSRSDLAADVTA